MTGRVEAGFSVAVVLVLVSVVAMPVFASQPPTPDDDTIPAIGDRVGGPSSVPTTATASVDDRTYVTAQAAIDAAQPGDRVVLEGTFEERLRITTSDLTITASHRGAAIDAGGAGKVVTVAAENTTLEGLWVRNSGADVDREDAGVYVDGNDTTLRGLHLDRVAYGVWVDGVDRVTVVDSRIEGREDVFPLTDRGNGIHLWETEDTTIRNNSITRVRDGIYYSWAERVVATDNAMWDNRYGVHYMYSNDNRLANNTAVDNDVGFALMVSQRLEIVNNTAVRNDGTSGHGILIKEIERSEVSGNDLVANRHGLYVYNAQNNVIADNLVLRNGVGVHATAASSGQHVVGNSFIHNGDAVLSTTTDIQAWNGSGHGNYWSDAETADVTGDGISEIRHRPAGLVEYLVAEQPQAAVFANSPAFEAVRLAESSFPVVEAPGVIDHLPLVESPHDWRHYDEAGRGDRSNGDRTDAEPIRHGHDRGPDEGQESDDGHEHTREFAEHDQSSDHASAPVTPSGGTDTTAKRDNG